MTTSTINEWDARMKAADRYELAARRGARAMTLVSKSKRPCQCCGRPVAMRKLINRIYGGGKARVRHKCPHGRWCVAGTIIGQHANVPMPTRLGGCPECNAREIALRPKEIE
jgi:hypothetical protein